MKQVNYNLKPMCSFLNRKQNVKDEVADLIKEKSAEKSAEKVEAKAEEIIADRAIQETVKNNASMQILANINMATVSGVQIAPNKNSEPSNIIQKFVANNAANNIDEIVNNQEMRNYDQLVAGWDNFINSLPQSEPEAYSQKIEMLNNIITAAEHEGKTPEADMWKCRRYIMMQNYITALLSSYNSVYPNGPEGINSYTDPVHHPLANLAELGLSINGYEIGSDANVFPNPDIFSYINIQSPYAHCASQDVLDAINSFHGPLNMGGGWLAFLPNEDPQKEYLFDMAMISFHRARIQAIQARINQFKNNATNYSEYGYIDQYLSNLQGYINGSTIIVNKLRERIHNFESIYPPETLAGYTEMMNFPGLTPTPPRPVEAPPSSSQIPNPGENRPDALINFYNGILDKYEVLNPESNLPEGVAINEVGTETYTDEQIQPYIDRLDNLEQFNEEEQLVLILIIAAMRLGNQTATDYWISKLDDLT